MPTSFQNIRKTKYLSVFFYDIIKKKVTKDNEISKELYGQAYKKRSRVSKMDATRLPVHPNRDRYAVMY